eukprot:TRINITY_DN6676_c0_g2_i1.p4 TRINITY_DN6676_c0_g2~~TRINITY_DN6676_c0_g2_i1.p4  ORF type:complete len:111 (+),score=18.83 TRINITY_DN6676_c0_g2_i1:465-797(+)
MLLSFIVACCGAFFVCPSCVVSDDFFAGFVLGQSSMPLSVYESPLMKSFRRFKQRRREGIHEQGSDGYYIVQRTVDTGQQAPHTSDSEVWFLYGRGPVFDPKTEEEDPLA